MATELVGIVGAGRESQRSPDRAVAFLDVASVSQNRDGGAVPVIPNRDVDRVEAVKHCRAEPVDLEAPLRHTLVVHKDLDGHLWGQFAVEAALLDPSYSIGGGSSGLCCAVS
ncbi:hypothetical protein [Streptomyces vinaceus]|uniref:hypothetical protein n=1 Tax=Streptomyces vinaceus TaxID=1960 RepID=UPI00123E4E48|nr:hypothetical protein [Streptomyces vinaceus]